MLRMSPLTLSLSPQGRGNAVAASIAHFQQPAKSPARPLTARCRSGGYPYSETATAKIKILEWKQSAPVMAPLRHTNGPHGSRRKPSSLLLTVRGNIATGNFPPHPEEAA